MFIDEPPLEQFDFNHAVEVWAKTKINYKLVKVHESNKSAVKI